MKSWYKKAQEIDTDVDVYDIDFQNENSYAQSGYKYTLNIDPRYVIDNGDRENQFTVLFDDKPVAVTNSFNDAGEEIKDFIMGYQQPEPIEIDELQEAEKELGYTDYLGHAGYITSDGQLVDLSDKSGTRGKDHRSIGGGTKGMQEYIAKGNIRMDFRSGFMDIRKQPTLEQYQWIRQFAEEKNGDVTLDLQEGLGEERSDIYMVSDNRFYTIYEEGTPVEVIMGAIRSFYGQGYQSPISKFMSNKNWYKLAKS